MKKYIFSAFICSLLAMVGCQKSETEIADVQQSGKEVVVTANIQGSTDSRVTMTDQGTGGIKVEWNTSGETFQVTNFEESCIFTQIEETNQFTGTLPEGEELIGLYNWIFEYNSGTGEGEAVFDLSEQDGTLNDDYVYMQAVIDPAETPLTINFSHETFILKPTFKIGEETLDNETISEIVIGNLLGGNVKSGSTELKETRVNPSSQEDIYIFALSASYYYKKDVVLTFDVTAAGKEYSGTYTLTKTLQAGKLYTATIALEEETPDTTPYVTFSATGAQTFKMTGMNNIPAEGNGTLSYSTDGKNWTELTTDKGTEGISFGNGTDLRLKGTLTKGTGYYQYNYGNYFYYGATISFADATVPVACTGDIRTLVAGKDYLTADTGDAAFCRLFNNCTQLTSAPELPSEDLSTGCYAYMFSGCSGLTAAPELPSEDLAAGCYASMFYGCSGLTAAPELNATALAESCYQAMFQNCTKLETAPTLPATQLAKSCYNSMFRSCTSLTEAPELNATQLAEACYNAMFRSCTSLTAAPALNAQTLASSCYEYMFAGCTNLKAAPTLSAKNIAQRCYNSMFYECSALTTAPTTLPATTLYTYCYSSMFYGCTSLETAPTLPATTLAESCYSTMFDGCTSLKTAPELKATILTESCYESMFSGCSSLNSITMLATNISAKSCLNMWVYGVAASGTFTKAASMNSLPSGMSGTPSGWTIKNK